MADDPSTVTLTRIDVTHRSSTDTRIGVAADGINPVTLALDAESHLWLSWDRTLAGYDPATGAIHRWPLPPLSNPFRASAARTAVVHPSYDPTDGGTLAMAVSSDNEVWLLVHGVQAVFGFNPSTSSWDRMLPLPLLPFGLVAPKPGTLMLSGANIQGHNETPRLALVDTTTGLVSVQTPKSWYFALVNRDEAVYIDASGGLGALNLSDGSTRMLAAAVPVNALFVADGSGHIWFSLSGDPAAGVGRLDIESGVVTRFPFPYYKVTPFPAMCPGLMPHECPSSSPSLEAQGISPDEIQVITPDTHGNVWVVTTKNGSGDPYESTLASPVYELTSGA